MTSHTTIQYHPLRAGIHRDLQGQRPKIQIGLVTPHGKVLDKAAFARLSKADRLRAYLLMVYPASRRLASLARVCNVPIRCIATLLRGDLHLGLVQVVGRGTYQATPATPPAHVRLMRGANDDEWGEIDGNKRMPPLSSRDSMDRLRKL